MLNMERINVLFDELVPVSGKADSLAGELVRAVCRLGYRWWNDGDMVDVGYGKETCNAAARFLGHNGDKRIAMYVQKLVEYNYDDKLYEDTLGYLTTAVVDYVEENPSLRSQETVDMFSYYDPEFDVEKYEDDEEDW